MNDECFRKSLIEITDKNLLNNFVNEIFGYDLKNDQYVYIQYKIVHENIVINIYDNSYNNRFKAFIFTTNSNLESNGDIKYININHCYNSYKNNVIDSKLDLIGSLLISKSNDEKKEIISKLFDNDIKNILFKYFIT